MKKILLSMMAALFAVASFAQTAEMKQPLTKQFVSMAGAMNATPEKTYSLRSMVKGLQAPASPYKLGKKQALRRAEGEFSVEDLAGDWIQAQMMYDVNQEDYTLVPETPFRMSTDVTIEPGANNEVTIYGLFDPEYGITGTVDLDNFTITIPANQVIGTSSYGDVTMVNATGEGDFVATIYADGIEFEDYWFGSVPYNDSQARYTEIFHSILFIPNAVMQYTDDEGQEVAANLAAIMDEESNVVSVFNFGGFGLCVDIDLLSDKTFSINSNQIVLSYTSYGDYSPYGVSGNYLVDFVGKGTETTLTSDTDWTIYSTKSYWFGLQGPFTIELIDGSEFIYPEAETGELVTLPEGLTAVDYPFSYTLYAGSERNVAKQGTVKIAKDGNDFYFQGLDVQIPDAWVKGVYDAEKATVTIPVTFTGVYNSVGHFYAGYGGEDGPKALTLSYDADADNYSYSATVMIYNGAASTTYVYFYNGLFIGEKPQPTTPPAGLETVDMPYKGNYMYVTYDDFEEEAGTLKIGRNGDDVYVQGLFNEDIEGCWLKGVATTIEDAQYIIFPVNQYVGDLSNGLAAYLVGYMPAEEEGQEGTVGNAVLYFDPETSSYYAITHFILTRSKSSTSFEAFYQMGLTIGEAATGIDTITADLNKADGTWYNINGMRIARPTQKGLYINNGKKYVVK